jgi:hypothetical protein
MDNMEERARQASEKEARKSAMIKKWEEGAEALRKLDTPDQSIDRKEREEEAQEARRGEEVREAQERGMRRIREEDRETAQAKRRADSIFFFLFLTIIGSVAAFYFIRWLWALLKK